MTSRQFPLIPHRQRKMLEQFLDYPSGLNLDQIREKFGYIYNPTRPVGHGDQAHAEMTKLTIQGLLETITTSSGHVGWTLSSGGEDYILEVVWKDE